MQHVRSVVKAPAEQADGPGCVDDGIGAQEAGG